MARVAFYAPMKPPHSAKPSGDREMARNLMSAIGAYGDKVDLVSDLRVFDKSGDAGLQEDLFGKAELEADRLIHDLNPETDLWLTYHNSYKAPDLLGPKVCAARGIPYVQMESTRAQSRLNGEWDRFARAAHDACDAADVIFYHTANDLIALSRDKREAQVLAELPPFLPSRHLPRASDLSGPMLSVGMMRHGDKLASYRILADALRHLRGDWSLEIAGDGATRAEVEQLMAPHGARVRFLGQLERDALQNAYGSASLFVWPGVNEAYGMVYLEAQAAGLPVVAQDRPGVRDVLAPANYPRPEDGPEGLAHRMQALLDAPDLRRSEGARVRDYVGTRHLMPAASQAIWSVLRPMLEARA